jgi:ribonuclease P protein component
MANASAPDAPSGAFCVVEAPTLQRLKQRADFLKAAAAHRQHAPAFLLQARARDDGDPAVRVGFTCSKKVGNAVARNRAKRRLREAARLILPAHARPGWDYVLIGRPQITATHPFATLCTELAEAMGRVHESPLRAPREPRTASRKPRPATP